MRTLATLAAAVLAAACSRDLTVPPETTAPRILAIRPAAAYAGERITIEASGLDAAADANLVQFPAAVARGESISGGALVVRVPADAGSGQLTVTTGGGVSPSAGPFTYRGLGELRVGAVAGETPLLHKPYRIVALGGDTFLHSDLLLGLVRYSDPAFVRDLAVAVDALPWAGAGGAVAWLESDWSAEPPVSRLVRLDLAEGAVPLEQGLADFAGGGTIVAMRGPSAAPADDRIALLRTDAGGVTLALHDADTLAETQPAAALPSFVEERGCADAGEGQLVCLLREAAGLPLVLARVTPGASPAVEVIPLPPGTAIQEDAVDGADPLCAGPTSGGARMAAVGLDDGRLAVADLDGGPALAALVDTGSRTPARSLACAGGGAVLAPKLADDLLVAVDVEAVPAGEILWSANVPRASRAAVDLASGTVHAAGEGDNRVLVLDLATGALRARRSFDVLPGRAGAVQGAAWITADATHPATLVFALASPPGVLELPLSAAPGTFPVYRNRPDAIGVFGPFAPYDPAYRYYFTLREHGLAQSGDSWDFGAGAGALLGQDGPEDAYVGTSESLVTIDYPAKTVHPVPIAGATFRSLGLLQGGRVFAAITAGGESTVRAWTEAEAAAGDPAGYGWTAPGDVAGAALLDGVLWVFHWEGEVFQGTQLGAVLAPIRTVPMAEAFDRILAVSPNGRTFVTWEHQPYSWDTSVVVFAAGGIGYSRVATVPVQGTVSGVAFDGTGEALHVLTRSPDRVVRIE